jgi:hypothetical protein
VWSSLAFFVVMSPKNLDDFRLVGFGLERWLGLHWNSERVLTGIDSCIGLEYAGDRATARDLFDLALVIEREPVWMH